MRGETHGTEDAPKSEPEAEHILLMLPRLLARDGVMVRARVVHRGRAMLLLLGMKKMMIGGTDGL